MLLGASANRDDRAFTDAETFDINRDRGQEQNLGFGYGIHSCLVAVLARTESAITLEYLLDAMPDFEVDYDNLRRVSMTSVAGYANVPVRVRRRLPRRTRIPECTIRLELVMATQSVRADDDFRRARPNTRQSGLLRYQLNVVASNVVDAAQSAGGWLFDRRMAGWDVNVMVADRVGERALRILGADVLDLSGDLEAITEDPDRAATLAVAADVYSVDERVRRFVSTSDRSRAEVALWGDVGALTEKVSAVDYRLSAAARAFKAHARSAAGIPSDSVGSTEALFRCGVTALAPVAVRS